MRHTLLTLSGSGRAKRDRIRFLLKKAARAGMAVLPALLVVVLTAGMAYASGGEGGEHGPTAKDWILRIISFSVIFGGLVYVFFKYIRVLLRKRIEGIEASLAEAKAAREEALARLANVEARLKNKDEELKSLLNVAQENGVKEREQLIADGDRLTEDIISSAKDGIDAELIKARDSLRREAALMAVELAERMVKDNISDADRARIIEEYISKVGAEK